MQGLTSGYSFKFPHYTNFKTWFLSRDAAAALHDDQFGIFCKSFSAKYVGFFFIGFFGRGQTCGIVIIDHGEISLRYHCPLWHHKGLNSSAKEAKK